MKSGFNSAGILVTISVFLGVTTPANAEKCTGTWTQGQMTTLEFTGGNKVRYCFISQCFDEEFVGDKNSELQFPVGDNGAFIELKKRGANKYRADYRFGNARSRANYTCGK